MVYFTCDACGEQLKKPQVEKHYTQKCRNCSMLTCIDCCKDFYGDEYKTHTQCMTEEQRYSKEGRSGWDPVAGQAKGEKKQQQWIGRLRQVLESADYIEPSVRHITDSILDQENIPRKQVKFVNFVKNIMRNKARMSDIDKAWELFSQALQQPEKEPPPPKVEETKKEEQKATATNHQSQAAQEEEEDSRKAKKKMKKKKRKLDETMEVDASEQSAVKEEQTVIETEEPPTKKGKFDWDGVIATLLAQKGNSMKLNKLKKKCVAEYISQQKENAAHQTPEQIGAKFDKKLKKRKYRVLKDRVSLVDPDAEDMTAKGEALGAEEKQCNSPKPKPVAVNESTNKKTDLSFNKWEAASLGNSSQTDKFRRLMGIKTDKAPEEIAAKKRDDKKIFNDLEVGFERARATHFSAKGMGLGFS